MNTQDAHRTVSRYFGSENDMCSCGWVGRSGPAHVAAKRRVAEYRANRAAFLADNATDESHVADLGTI